MAMVLYTDGANQEVVLAENMSERLAQYRSYVGGYIEIVTLSGNRSMVINEEGKLRNLPYNSAATALYNQLGDHIVGNAVVLTAEETQQEYAD